VPKASQLLNSSLFNWPVRKEVFKDRCDYSIIIRSIISDEVANIRL
jgi:hypothetical protein